MENSKVIGISTEVVLESKTLSNELKARIAEADANNDGVLSIDELVDILKSEQSAVQQQRLFRRLLLFLSILMLLAVAALVGCVYAIVSLTQQIEDDNNVLLSKDSAEPMSIGAAKSLSTNFSSLLGEEALDYAMGLDHLIIPTGTEDLTNASPDYSVYSVIKVDLGQPASGATIHTASGETFEVDPSGELYMTDASTSTSTSGGSRRRLLAVYTVGGPPAGMTTSGVATHTPLGSPGDEVYPQKTCEEWQEEASKLWEERAKSKKMSKVLVYPSGMPATCRMGARAISRPN